MVQKLRDELIEEMYQDIVKLFEKKGFEIAGGNDRDFLMYRNPPIKVYINGIRDVDDQCSIVIRYY